MYLQPKQCCRLQQAENSEGAVEGAPWTVPISVPVYYILFVLIEIWFMIKDRTLLFMCFDLVNSLSEFVIGKKFGLLAINYKNMRIIYWFD